jgi:hypothetical protein
MAYVFLEFDFGSVLTIVVLLCLLRVWFWFRVDHCRPLMSTQSFILVQNWPLSSSYVYSELEFGSELTILWTKIKLWENIKGRQWSTLNQNQTLGKHKRTTTELTSVVLLCFLRVWFWFSVDHCRPLMFTQSLILVQSWPLSSSYVYSEFDFGSVLNIVVLLCLLRV